MSSLMRFEVLAPDKYVLKSDAISYVEAVTLWGGVGILPRHAPLIAALKEAPLKYRDAEGIAHFLCIQGGFMEVKDRRIRMTRLIWTALWAACAVRKRV